MSVLFQELLEIAKFVDYDPKSGQITWAQDYYGFKKGSKCGSENKGQLVIKVKGKPYRGYELAFALTQGRWPVGKVNFKDGNPKNLKIENIEFPQDGIQRRIKMPAPTENTELAKYRYDPEYDEFGKGKAILKTVADVIADLKKKENYKEMVFLQDHKDAKGYLIGFLKKYNMETRKAFQKHMPFFDGSPAVQHLWEQISGNEPEIHRLVDLKSGDAIYYNSNLNKVEDMTDDGIKSLNLKLFNHLKEEGRSVPVKSVFKPYDSAERLSEPNPGRFEFNAYDTPSWAFASTTEQSRNPEHILWMLDHLFGSHDESVHYFKCWLRHALFVGKNFTNITMVAIKGLGKGVFFDNVLTPLFSNKYTLVSTTDTINSTFNGELWRKLMVCFDEVVLNRANMAKFRSLMGETSRFEHKGKNAFDDTNHANFILFSNNKEDVGLEKDDRRFSVPVTGSRKLEDACQSDLNISPGDLIEKIKSEIPAFANYLREYDIGNWKSEKPLKTERFYELVSIGQKEFITFITESIKNEELMPFNVMVSYEDLMRAAEKVSVRVYGDQQVTRREFRDLVTSIPELEFIEEEGVYYLKRIK
jgi:hypothetical protein